MRVSTGKITIAAAAVAGLFFATCASAAERDHGTPSSTPAPFVKKRSNSGDSFWGRQRGYSNDNNGWFFGRPLWSSGGQRTRDLDPTPEVVERPEQPLVYQPEKLEALRATLPDAAPDGLLPA